MEAEDLALHAMPLYHCAQLDAFLGPAIYLGATNLVIGKPTADLILSRIAAHRVTSFFAPPTIWIAMLRSPAFDRTDLSSLRKGYYGASIMPVEVLLAMQRRMPQVRLWNFYGQTEIAPLATVLKPEDQLRKAGSAGKPALNVETRVVTYDMKDVAPGEIGEIVHRSPHLMTGHYHNPEKAAAAFAGGWFHSGDLATVDEEGYVAVVDRVKDMIKTGGENVASREVEETIYRLPQVDEVAVVGLPDPRWAEAVTAVIVVKDRETQTAEAVLDHCAQSMARFKAPKSVIFVDSFRATRAASCSSANCVNAASRRPSRLDPERRAARRWWSGPAARASGIGPNRLKTISRRGRRLLRRRRRRIRILRDHRTGQTRRHLQRSARRRIGGEAAYPRHAHSRQKFPYGAFVLKQNSGLQRTSKRRPNLSAGIAMRRAMLNRRNFPASSSSALLASVVGLSWAPMAFAAGDMVAHSDAEWRKLLTADRYAVLRQAGAERPFTSPWLHETRAGVLSCAGCDLPNFFSETRFDSGTGWPSFWAPIENAVKPSEDKTFGMTRDAVAYSRSDGHLGPVCSDGPQPTGLRYGMR